MEFIFNLFYLKMFLLTAIFISNFFSAELCTEIDTNIKLFIFYIHRIHLQCTIKVEIGLLSTLTVMLYATISKYQFDI